jgi:hypothetical protein
MSEIYSAAITPVRLLGKRTAFLLGPNPIGHLQFLPKLAQVLASCEIESVFGNKKDSERLVCHPDLGPERMLEFLC